MQTDKYFIRVLAKKSAKHKHLLNKYRHKIEIVYGDIRDKNICDILTKDIDFVIHLAAVIPPKVDFHKQLTKEVNLNGTLNLIEAIERNSPKAFLLFSSSISVYGDRLKNPWIKTSDKLQASPNDYYALTKIKTESEIQKSNLNWSIFRLTAIMHPKQKFDPLMFHMPLETKMEICTTANTATALINAIEKTHLLNKKIFNLGGGEKCRVKYKEFLNNCLSLSGLGSNAFPEKIFAKNNFHCGFYEDSDILNKILDFQSHSVEDYYRQFSNGVGPAKRFLAKIFKHFVIAFFLFRTRQINSKYYKKSHPV